MSETSRPTFPPPTAPAPTTPTRAAVDDGFALIAVIVALGMLLALSVPFVTSMGHGDAVSVQAADRKHAELMSASVRTIALERAGLSHPSLDETPRADSLDEFPDGFELPEGFEALATHETSKHLLAAEIEDLQRRINVNTATPLVLGNLLSVVTHLAEDHDESASELVVRDASNFPEEGWVIVDRELIHYGSRDGTTLRDLDRGMLAVEMGYVPQKGHNLARETLVLDYRVVLAAMHSFYHRGLKRDQLARYESVDELNRIGEIENGRFGRFEQSEMDVFRRTCTAASVRETTGEWGRPRRLFEPVNLSPEPWKGTLLRLRDARAIPAGSIVRITDQDGKNLEYGLVIGHRPFTTGTTNLPTSWALRLLRPPSRSLPEMQTIVEPLLPHPVNMNTAPKEVLTALIRNVRNDKPGHAAPAGRGYGRAEAEQYADVLIALRGDGDPAVLADGPFQGTEIRPFEGFADLSKRFMEPLLGDASQREKQRFILLYQSLIGNDVGRMEMGTAPLTFTSGSIVSYRAAAARVRGDRTVAQHERQGLAAVMPDAPLDIVLYQQAQLEEAFRLDARAPFYTTFPINMGTWIFGSGSNPISRHWAHVVGLAFPDQGLGEPRYPSLDGLTDGFKAATSRTPFNYRDVPAITRVAQQSMWSSRHPEGRDIATEGPYLMFNDGPRQPGGGTTARPAGSGRSHDPTFPFSDQNALVSRHAISFWFYIRDLGDQVLYDLAHPDDADRNRVSVRMESNTIVFEVMDNAGIDPDPAQAGTSPARTAGTWRVSTDEVNLQANTWYHVNIGAEGNRPGQLTMLVDGVPRGEPELRTYLTTPLPAYTSPQQVFEPFWSDPEKYTELQVESTDGFPPQGVLRVGLELFEYTSIRGNTFVCAWNNSMGGRAARMSLSEYVPAIPVDENGRPTINVENVTGGQNLRAAPAHDIGSMVELYGYTVQIYRNYDTQVGEARLADPLGAFAVARIINKKNLKPISLQGQPPLFFGEGMDSTFNDDIELGNPVATPVGQAYGSEPEASPEVLGAFSINGGYALLVQRALDLEGPGGTAPIGGIELIRYGGRDGNRLTGVQRGLAHPLGIQPVGAWTATQNQYVLDWQDSLVQPPGPNGEEADNYHGLMAYAVPISISVIGTVLDPTILGRTEWLQIYSGSGQEENSEWVRYDWVDGQNVVRTQVRSWLQVLGALTGSSLRERQSVTNPPQIQVRGIDEVEQILADLQTSLQQRRQTEGVDFIGYVDLVESNFPVVYTARTGTALGGAFAGRGLEFRGDPFTRTTSHAQPSNALVTQCQRMELDWGNYGARSGRIGRNDRIALVGGNALTGPGGSGVPVEWFTANWSMRRFGSDQPPQNNSNNPVSQIPQELLGTYPFQLVGFKSGVNNVYIGAPQRNFFEDTRRLDRLVKFPSGELPASPPDDAYFGGTIHRDVAEARGIVDELVAVTRRATPVMLDQPMSDSAQELFVRNDLLITPQGDAVVQNGNYTQNYPTTGGLLAVDGEIMAYESHGAGRFGIANNGRGLLGTQARQHDEGALVYFLDHVPAAILTAPINQSTHEFVVQSLGDLPRHGGTLMIGGTELAHYTWTVGDRLLGMPEWVDPERSSTRGNGLFRGRFGTAPSTASSGEPVIWFPFRYWDRHHDRADDPELSYFQVSRTMAPVFFEGLRWEEERDDQLIGIECLVRIDGQAKWSDDPKTTDALYLFTDPTGPGGVPNKIHRQGSWIEARFSTVYRPGAFDPQTYLLNSWKKAPFVRSRASDDLLAAPAVMLTYEGEGRILTERITSQ